jgi:hypothetical protein
MKKVISVIAVLILVFVMVAGCDVEPPLPEQSDYSYDGAPPLAAQPEFDLEEEPVEVIAEDAFRGILDDVMDSLFEHLAEISLSELDGNAFESVLALRFNAAPGAVADIASDLGLDDSFIIQLLDLLVASSFEFRNFVDLRDDVSMSSNILWFVQNQTDGGLSEILRTEALVVDNSIYLRSPQLLESFFELDFIFDFDLDPEFGMYTTFNNEPFPIVDLLEFLIEQENEFRALVSDVTGAFLDNLDINMSVEYDVPVTVGGGIEHFNKAVITARENDLAIAVAEALKVIRDNDEHLTLLIGFDKLLNPVDYYTIEDLRVLISDEIVFLEVGAEQSSRETFDIYIYIDENDLVVGFGITSHFDDLMLEIVFVEDVGFHFIFTEGNDILRLYGSHSSGTISRGDLYISFRDNMQNLEGKLFDFEYSDDQFSLTVLGRDIFNLFDDEAISSEELPIIAEFLFDSEFTLTIEGDNESVNITLTVRHLDPEISLNLELDYVLRDDISIERPSSENVIHLDVSDMTSEDENVLEALLLNEIDPFELFGNLAQILDNLTQQGFDLSELLTNILFELY